MMLVQELAKTQAKYNKLVEEIGKIDTRFTPSPLPTFSRSGSDDSISEGILFIFS